VRVERRFDQPGWFVACEVCGTLAAGLSMREASRRAAGHRAGDDSGGLNP
jgi:hypothetical protein